VEGANIWRNPDDDLPPPDFDDNRDVHYRPGKLSLLSSSLLNCWCISRTWVMIVRHERGRRSDGGWASFAVVTASEMGVGLAEPFCGGWLHTAACGVG